MRKASTPLQPASNTQKPASAMKDDRRSLIELPSRCRRVQVAVTTSNTTHHQAETPNRYKSISANQAPTLPPRLRISPAATLWDHPGSARLKVVRTRERYRAPAARTNSLDSRSSAATLPGRGAWFRFKAVLIVKTPTAPRRAAVLIDAGILADEEPLASAASAGRSEHSAESALRRPVIAAPSAPRTGPQSIVSMVSCRKIEPGRTSMYPPDWRSFITRLTISREAPIIFAMSCLASFLVTTFWPFTVSAISSSKRATLPYTSIRARLPIFWSASRSRLTSPRMTVMAISKFSARHFLKSRFERVSSSQASRATTLADRG